MPELPEVEIIVRGLDKRVRGDTIESVWIGSRKQPLKSPAGMIAATTEGKRIVRVHRAGKHIVFDLEGEADSEGQAHTARPSTNKLKRTVRPQPRQAASLPTAQWIIHLGMTGRMVVCEDSTDIAKHTHLIASLKSGRQLRFIDPRMFGKLSVHKAGTGHPFDPGGIEPLEVNETRFIALFQGRKTPIKSALLNQKLLRGVGNIYADESLFRAGLRPRRRAASIPRAQLGKLHRAVQEVLREAIALGGSSISDYVNADGEEGSFQLEHRVYGREGEPCVACGNAIRRVVLAGRSSHYCPTCQK